ncbi:MAG: polymer-forming cytoskeletal protein [Cellvibrionaceae bacterium]|nr:polymer-forming cytoskeletal protein [Cellvibrionaceae bacterium]
MSSIKTNTTYKTTTNTSTPAAPKNGASPNPSATMTTNTPLNTEKSTPEVTATAVIGPKIRVKGELVGEEDILVQGQVDGLVDLKDHTLTIGEQGVVRANVLAKTITIEGTVEGDLFGQERISILSSSNVQGNLVADRVILEDGAKFRGSIDMDVDAHKEQFNKLTPAPATMVTHQPGINKPQNNSPSNGGANASKKG